MNSGHGFGFFKAQVAIFEQELNRQKTSHLNEKEVQNGKIFVAIHFQPSTFERWQEMQETTFYQNVFFLIGSKFKIQNMKHFDVHRCLSNEELQA